MVERIEAAKAELMFAPADFEIKVKLASVKEGQSGIVTLCYEVLK